MLTQPKSNNLDDIIDPTFRLFVSSFKDCEDNPTKNLMPFI